MSFVIYSFSLFSVLVSIFSVAIRILRRKTRNIVFYTQGFWFINIISIWFSVLLSVFYYRNEDSETLFICTMFLVLSILSNIVYCNEIIIFEDDSFFVRNFWGFKNHYSYSDVTGFMLKKQRYRHSTETKAIFYTENKKFSVFILSHNYPIFFEKLNSEYKKYNRGRNLPQLKNKPQKKNNT